MSEEVWKTIPGFEGLYEVSNLGRIRSVKIVKGRSLTKSKRGKRRIYVALYKNGRKTNIAESRVLALAFIGPAPSPKHVVNHKDHNPLNNDLDNLEWATQKENMEHAVKHQRIKHGETHKSAKLTEKEVIEICRLIGTKTDQEIADQYKVSRSAIRNIKYGITWKHITKSGGSELPTRTSY